MSDIVTTSWSEVDASNSQQPPEGWPAGMFPNAVEPAARMNMGAVKRFWNRVNPVYAAQWTTGDSFVVSPSVAIAGYGLYETWLARFTDANVNSSPTVNISTIGPQPLKKYNGTGGVVNLLKGDIQAQDHEFYWDGSRMIVRNPARVGGWILLDALTASNSASLNFIKGIDGTYDRYALVADGIIPQTNATDLWLRVSEDGGATWKQGVNSYNSARSVVNSTPATVIAGNSDTKFTISGSLSNAAATGLDFEMHLTQPASTTRDKSIGGMFRGYLSDANWYSGHTAGNYLGDQAAINGLQILMSSGNIVSGNVYLFGIAK